MFNKGRSLVFGMIHIHALPGTPRNNLSVSEIIKSACKDAETYKRCKVDGVVLENMHDLPYVPAEQLGPEVTACMTAVATAVHNILPHIPCGVQVLAGGNRQALAVAQAAGLDFIRAEGFVFSHVADEGLMHACAGDLLRYRKQIRATNIKIFTDIKKKHCSHAITSDIDIGTTAKAAQFFLSDGLIVTGSATGDPPSQQDVTDVRRSSSLPVLIGSGVTKDNLHEFLDASGFIIGSHFKYNGRWENEVSEEKVLEFIEKLISLTKETKGS